MKPFDYLNAVSHTKEDLMTGTDNDDLAEKAYEPYLVNKGLSYFTDTILYSNEMNRLHLLDNKPQFSYLLNTLRPRKRFSKWFKPELDEASFLISQIYGYSNEKANQVKHLFSQDQLDIMRQKLEKGGLKKEKKNAD